MPMHLFMTTLLDEIGGMVSVFYFVIQYLFTYKQNRYRIHPSIGWHAESVDDDYMLCTVDNANFWIILMKINRFNCVKHNR